MSIETEINVESEAKPEPSIAEVKSFVDGVVAEADKTYAEAKKFEGAVASDVKKVATLSSDEKLILRDLETAFLRAQLDMKAAADRSEEIQKAFTQTVARLGQKYEIDPTKKIFDVTTQVWKDIEAGVNEAL